MKTYQDAGANAGQREHMSDIVQKLWGLCHTLRHDGVDFPQPGRAEDNSPAIYRWVHCPQPKSVP